MAGPYTVNRYVAVRYCTTVLSLEGATCGHHLIVHLGEKGPCSGRDRYGRPCGCRKFTPPSGAALARAGVA